ncbi:HAMP domain-containing sensor histidine kinase [uncultured Chryseobacterium sp.]|uniref:sensor histidine kinase n=1 Tax=uncultured Chryseobacterium sp. TaxID=259322 RepID=UPI002626C78E|nr:HAMP domain-containing sensor histidine kinase [uncultured Chryseobacterium sp.]
MLIQVIIAVFFYNEFVNEKKLDFIKSQLEESRALQGITDTSKKELFNAQNYLQKYLLSKDDQYLQLYFTSLRKLNSNFEKISVAGSTAPRIKKILEQQKRDTLRTEKLKVLIDSADKFAVNAPKPQNQQYNLEKYKAGNSLDHIEIETQTYSDTIKKKGLMGRLKDAISGKVDVQKESTIVTFKNNKTADLSKVKSEINNTIESIDKHYIEEVRKIRLQYAQNERDNMRFYSNFHELLIYSNGLVNVYESAIDDFKAELEKEYSKQSSINNKIRTYSVLGLMILMFIVSVLIMYFTRVAFIYELKLNAANKEIRKNLNFKNRILGMLSHELRSPLKIVNIFIDKITRTTQDENVKEYLKSIKFTNNTMLLQSNQILEYTKDQEAGKTLVNTSFDLKKEIESITTAITPYIETRNNKFIVNDRIPEGMLVYSDNIKINRLFMNILGNANKFTENGTITLDVVAERINENKISFTATISDTGVGISESDLEKIFEPYYQGTLSDEIDNLGAGLGLNLCKEIVELFNGEISASSKIGEGTKMTFRINLNIQNNGIAE